MIRSCYRIIRRRKDNETFGERIEVDVRDLDVGRTSKFVIFKNRDFTPTFRPVLRSLLTDVLWSTAGTRRLLEASHRSDGRVCGRELKRVTTRWISVFAFLPAFMPPFFYSV